MQLVQLVQLWCDCVKYPERESRTLECKSTLPVFKKLLKTCVAFANGYGGRLVIGVDDDLTILGVSETIMPPVI